MTEYIMQVRNSRVSLRFRNSILPLGVPMVPKAPSEKG